MWFDAVPGPSVSCTPFSTSLSMKFRSPIVLSRNKSNMASPFDTTTPEHPNHDIRSAVSVDSTTKATPSGTSPILPCELLVVIAWYAIIFEDGINILKVNNSQPLTSFIERGVVYFYDIDGGAQTRLAQLSRVNKTWHEALTPLLLARPVLSTPLRLRQLSKYIDLHPRCGDYIRELVLCDTDTGKGESFFHVTPKNGRKGSRLPFPPLRKNTDHALRVILEQRASGSVRIVLHMVRRAQSLVPSLASRMNEIWGGLSRFGMRVKLAGSGKTSNSMDACTMMEAISGYESVGSLTINGPHDNGWVGSNLFSSSNAQSARTFHGFPYLRYLCLSRLTLSHNVWPSAPLLTTLVIDRCIWFPFSLPSRSEAPSLVNLQVFIRDHVFGNRPLTYMSSFLKYLLPHSQHLHVLVLHQSLYNLVLDDPEISRRFSKLAKLGVDMSGLKEQDFDVNNTIPSVLPPKLGMLSVDLTGMCVEVNKCASHARAMHAFILFDPLCAKNALTSPIQDRTPAHFYGLIILFGSSIFWNNVPMEVMVGFERMIQDSGLECFMVPDRSTHLKIPMKELYLRVQSLFGNSAKGTGPGMVVWWDHLPSKNSI